jgi:hypothetical protein
MRQKIRNDGKKPFAAVMKDHPIFNPLQAVNTTHFKPSREAAYRG